MLLPLAAALLSWLSAWLREDSSFERERFKVDLNTTAPGCRTSFVFKHSVPGDFALVRQRSPGMLTPALAGGAWAPFPSARLQSGPEGTKFAINGTDECSVRAFCQYQNVDRRENWYAYNEFHFTLARTATQAEVVLAYTHNMMLVEFKAETIGSEAVLTFEFVGEAKA